MITLANQDFARMNVCGVLIWRGCNDQQVCVQSVPGMWADGKWSPKESQSILRWVFPLMVRRRRYGSLTCDRNTNPPPPPNPLRVAPNARKLSTQGSTTWSRGAVSPDMSYETLLWEWGRGCLLTWPRIAPPVRTPPSQPNTGVLYPGASFRTWYASSPSIMMGGGLWTSTPSSGSPLGPSAGFSRHIWNVGEIR